MSSFHALMTRFDRDGLTEYAEVFNPVCVDAAYDTFLSQKYLEGLVAQVPGDFRFGDGKVPIKSFLPGQRRVWHY